MNDVIVKQIHYPHADLISVAQVSLEFAKEQKTGLLACANFMASIIYSAYALEAYLNFFGSRYISDWEEIEKIMRPFEKLVKITEHFNRNIDRSRRPFLSFSEIFKFRNSLAYARVKNLEEEKKSIDSFYIPPDHEKIIASEKPKQFCDDAVEMIKILHYELEGYSKEHDPFVIGETTIV